MNFRPQRANTQTKNNNHQGTTKPKTKNFKQRQAKNFNQTKYPLTDSNLSLLTNQIVREGI